MPADRERGRAEVLLGIHEIEVLGRRTRHLAPPAGTRHAVGDAARDRGRTVLAGGAGGALQRRFVVGVGAWLARLARRAKPGPARRADKARAWRAVSARKVAGQALVLAVGTPRAGVVRGGLFLVTEAERPRPERVHVVLPGRVPALERPGHHHGSRREARFAQRRVALTLGQGVVGVAHARGEVRKGDRVARVVDEDVGPAEVQVVVAADAQLEPGAGRGRKPSATVAAVARHGVDGKVLGVHTTRRARGGANVRLEVVLGARRARVERPRLAPVAHVQAPVGGIRAFIRVGASRACLAAALVWHSRICVELACRTGQAVVDAVYQGTVLPDWTRLARKFVRVNKPVRGVGELQGVDVAVPWQTHARRLPRLWRTGTRAQPARGIPVRRLEGIRWAHRAVPRLPGLARRAHERAVPGLVAAGHRGKVDCARLARLHARRAHGRRVKISGALDAVGRRRALRRWGRVGQVRPCHARDADGTGLGKVGVRPRAAGLALRDGRRARAVENAPRWTGNARGALGARSGCRRIKPPRAVDAERVVVVRRARGARGAGGHALRAVVANNAPARRVLGRARNARALARDGVGPGVTRHAGARVARALGRGRGALGTEGAVFWHGVAEGLGKFSDATQLARRGTVLADLATECSWWTQQAVVG